MGKIEKRTFSGVALLSDIKPHLNLTTMKF